MIKSIAKIALLIFSLKREISNYIYKIGKLEIFIKNNSHLKV